MLDVRTMTTHPTMQLFPWEEKDWRHTSVIPALKSLHVLKGTCAFASLERKEALPEPKQPFMSQKNGVLKSVSWRLVIFFK